MLHHRLLPLALLSALVLPAQDLFAQSDTIRVGRAGLSAVLLARATDTTVAFAVQGEQKRPLMTYTEQTVPSKAGVLIVGRNVAPNGRIVTTDSVMVSPTLAPVWHWDMTPRGQSRVTYGAGSLKGTRTDSTGAQTPVDMAVHGGAFDYSMAMRLVGHLPLRAGYSGVLATHDITRGPVYVPFKVLGEERLTVKGAPVDTWKVEVAISPTSTATRWIDKRTKKDVKVSVTIPGGLIVVE